MHLNLSHNPKISLFYHLNNNLLGKTKNGIHIYKAYYQHLSAFKLNETILEKLQHNIEMAFLYLDKREPKVSEKGVDWHLDHMFKVIIGISRVLKESNPQDYRPNFNASRAYVFSVNKIPRGKAQAPKAVLPPEIIEPEEIKYQYEKVLKCWKETRTLPAKCNFNHPVFGQLNLRQTRKFLKLHTKHHLDIINDIIIATT